MQHPDIIALRLRNQCLAERDFRRAEDVVTHFGAVQAQDFAAAKWSLGLRMASGTDEAIGAAFDAGKFLRTHVMRPTWHFVMPQDIRWLLELTRDRVKKSISSYDRRLEITPSFILRCHGLIHKALEGGRWLTRAQIEETLAEHGITANGQRLAHVVTYAELNGLICSGPRRGKQLTYALLEERVPPAPPLSREEALKRLARRYFRSHGPAQIPDLAWWAGLTVKDARAAVEALRPEMDTIAIDGKTYYHFPSEAAAALSESTLAFLMSIYDEYTIAYKDRSDLSEGRAGDLDTMLAMGNALTAVVVLGGRLAGTWKRYLKKSGVEVVLSLFRAVSPAEAKALRAAAARYGAFLGLPVTVIGL